MLISFVIICTLENECTDWQCKFETSSILRWKSQNHYIFTYLYSVWRSMSDLYLVLRTKYTVYAVTEQIYSLTSVKPNNNIPKDIKSTRMQHWFLYDITKTTTNRTQSGLKLGSKSGHRCVDTEWRRSNNLKCVRTI